MVRTSAMQRFRRTRHQGDRELAEDRGRTPEDEEPFYRRHVFCCTNTREQGHPRGCCSDKDSVRLRNYMKVKARKLGLEDVRINAAGCLDRCELGPTMVIYPEGVWYRCRTTEDIDEVLQTHLVRGGRVARLMLRHAQK